MILALTGVKGLKLSQFCKVNLAGFVIKITVSKIVIVIFNVFTNSLTKLLSDRLLADSAINQSH